MDSKLVSSIKTNPMSTENTIRNIRVFFFFNITGAFSVYPLPRSVDWKLGSAKIDTAIMHIDNIFIVKDFSCNVLVITSR